MCVCFHYQVWLADDWWYIYQNNILSFHHVLFVSPTTSHRPSLRRFLQNWGSLMTSCITAVRNLGTAFRSHGGSQVAVPVMDEPFSIETHGGVRTPSFRTHAENSFLKIHRCLGEALFWYCSYSNSPNLRWQDHVAGFGPDSWSKEEGEKLLKWQDQHTE